ncbi:uncharacterized protein LOC116349657 isoform X2 [Contarinia nasturtii]|uniref:uncharacterized protein LOC116349657 isoform X2 n=1 Tax=Contarinia nasturtii TaxID=265458 RepID=UPI0012D4441F|nr:uncharacterized protein LOC116349657 isoform X2 [Contarinia nasturtii]
MCDPQPISSGTNAENDQLNDSSGSDESVPESCETIYLNTTEPVPFNEFVQTLSGYSDQIELTPIIIRGGNSFIQGAFHLKMPRSIATQLFGPVNGRRLQPFSAYPIYINNNVPIAPLERPNSVGAGDGNSSHEPNTSPSDCRSYSSSVD